MGNVFEVVEILETLCSDLDDDWLTPCRNVIDDLDGPELVLDDVGNDLLAACAFYFVAVGNHIGGPNEAYGVHPQLICDTLEIDRGEMLMAYVDVIKVLDEPFHSRYQIIES